MEDNEETDTDDVLVRFEPVPDYKKTSSNDKQSAKEQFVQLEMFLNSIYGTYLKERVCSEEYRSLHEAVYFCQNLRRSNYLKTELSTVRIIFKRKFISLNTTYRPFYLNKFTVFLLLLIGGQRVYRSH